MKVMFSKWLKNDFTTLIMRLLPLYVVLLFTQIVFYLYNRSLLGNIEMNEYGLLLKGAFLFDTISILYLNVVFIVLSLLPFHFRERKWYQKMLFRIYIVSNSIGIVLLNIADAVYFRYAFKRLTLEDRHFLVENDNTASIVFTTMRENWFLLLVVVALIIFLVFCYKKIKYNPTAIKKKFVYYPVNTLLLLAMSTLFVFGVRGSFELKARPVTLSNAAYYTKDAQKASMVLSNPFCVIRMIGVKEFKSLHYFDDAQCAVLYSPYHHPDNQHIDTFKKKNVVIFVLESFSREHSHYLAPHLNPGGGYTPFLDSLMQEGYVFFNAYANGMKSIEALPSILTSIPSYQTPFPLLPQSVSKIEGLPALLAGKGYSTNFFCGARANQMGFESFCKLAGIDHFYSRESYEGKYGKHDEMANCWGIWDMPFYDYMAEELCNIKVPFFAAVFNLTSHHPYDLPAGYADKMPRGTTPMHPCVAYTDLSLKKFFEKASSMPWFENTLFIFVADHVSPQMAYAETRTMKGNTEIFYFMYTPDGSLKGSSKEVTQQLDIMPTTLGLLNYDRPYFAFGRDFFNEKDRYLVAVNCVQQVYQCLTDSLSLYFDGTKRLHVYSAVDTFQRNDIINLNDPQQERAENYLKAVLQTYTEHVKDKDYLYKKQ